jgi:hypothetical protein
VQPSTYTARVASKVLRIGIDRLFVLWRRPSDGTRRIVGELWREADGYAFSYCADLPIAEGFSLLPEFPQHRVAPAAYRAAYLFPTFAQRVPSPTRLDLVDLVRAWGVERVDDPLEILARSGGVQATDRIELSEYRSDEDTLDQPLEMRIAGATHYDQGVLDAGDSLELKREPENIHDRLATLFVFRGDQKVGYVPRQYAAMIAHLLDAGVALRASAVRRLSLPSDSGRWVARVWRSPSGSSRVP